MGKAIIAALLVICCVGAAEARMQTPPAVWMKAIKNALKAQLTGSDGAKFSRMFYDPGTSKVGTVAVCGRVISQEDGDADRTMRFFYAEVTPSGGLQESPAVSTIRIGLTPSETGEIWQTCQKLGLM